jgi:hypothetical protein
MRIFVVPRRAVRIVVARLAAIALPCTKRTLAAWALALVVVSVAGRAVAQVDVDLELVLAVDASGSVDQREYALQTGGIAAGFRDETVLAALQSGAQGQIAVALVTWADSATPKDVSPWHLIADAASAERFARMAESFPRRVLGGTGIGEAVEFSARQFDRNGLTGSRRVIDLSGDGSETTPRDFVVTPKLARVFALNRGITINALAILTDEPDLEAYYRAQIVGGPGAFTLAVASYEDFAKAIRAKLIREIEYRPEMSETGPPGQSSIQLARTKPSVKSARGATP